MLTFKNLRHYGFNTDRRYYVIAEIGINHGGSIEQAKKLIASAARAGVDAVKFQTYHADKRVDKTRHPKLYEILKTCELSHSDFKNLKACASDEGVEFLSTPFDNESVQFLEDIGCTIFKIASFDVVNLPFLKRLAQTKKTVILSTGMSNLEEIAEAYDTLREGTEKIALLHCISAYPSENAQANLASLFVLKSNFDCVIGQSDHTPDILVPCYAAAAGAQILEKHFKINSRMECVDAPVSITEEQMRRLVDELKTIDDIFGSETKELTPPEEPITVYRRNLTFTI